MSKVNQSELFIRLLADVLEKDGVIRKAALTLRSRASATRFQQLFKSDLDHAMRTVEPMSRVRRTWPEHPDELRFD